MPKNRFSWHKEPSSQGGWQNADFEFTQLDFSESTPDVRTPTASSSFQQHQNDNQEDDDDDADDYYINCRFDTAQRTTCFIEPTGPTKEHKNQSHYLCTLLPSRKAYIEQPNLEPTLARRRTIRSKMQSNRTTMSSQKRPAFMGALRYEVSEDQIDFGGSVMTEQDYWEQMIAIKAMAAPMNVKKQYREKLQSSTASIKASGSNKWRRYVSNRQQKLSDFRDEFKKSFNLWKNPLKVIEGYYGTGIVSYFVFIRWLLMLNFIMFLLIFVFVIIPPLIFKKVQLCPPSNLLEVQISNETLSGNSSTELSLCNVYEDSSIKYKEFVHNNTQKEFKSYVQDLLQGTGWMELTVMFYGAFSPNNLQLGYFSGKDHWYMLPLAYLIVTVVYFAICLIMMIRSIIEGSKESLVIHEAQFYRYFNLAFGSWDFCITDANSAELKKKSIFVDIQSNLKEDEFVSIESQRTAAMKMFIYTVRFVLNVLSIAILVGAGYLIYFVTVKSVEIYQNEAHELDKFVVLLVEFLTPLTITFLNLILPVLFNAMVQLEQYRPHFAISITLFRTVFVRLASLGVLMSTFSSQITCDVDEDEHCVKIHCWETYVGQQLYKLVIVDFLVVIVITFVVETPRRLVADIFSSVKLVSIIGKPEFDIAKHVLDLIYGQTLCWLGVFYCPMLPAIGVIKCLVFFYVKKFTLLHNCKPTMHAYKASRSNIFFFLVLFLAFLLTCIPLVYSFLNFPPSKGCGPFRLNENIWSEIFNSIVHWPTVLQKILGFIATAGFAIPCFIVLCLLIYYYYMLRSAYKQLALVIKEQLKEEGRDKQYLLSRLTQQT